MLAQRPGPGVEHIEEHHPQIRRIRERAADQQFITDHAEVLELLVMKVPRPPGRRLAERRAVVVVATVDASHRIFEKPGGDIAVFIDQ